VPKVVRLLSARTYPTGRQARTSASR